MKIKIIQEIDVNEWDRLVEETYGRSYSFQQQDGCKDRGSVGLTVPSPPSDYDNCAIAEIVNNPDRGVSFAAWLARDPKQLLKNRKEEYARELWWERNFYPDVQMIANDLHAKGLLPAGEYSIKIDW